MRTFAARAGTPGRTRALAVALIVSGVGLILLLSWFVNHGESFMFTMHYNYYFGDLVGRVVNLQTLRQTGNIYVPFGAEAFTYPPGAILFFWPIQWVPAQHLTLVWTIGSLVALAGAYYVALDFLTKIPRGLIAGVSLWGAVITAIVFPEVTECLTWGQTATVLMLLVLLDELVVRGPAKGVMVGVATAVKIYPGLFIIAWLLRRDWRPALTALATTAVMTISACVLWPTSARTFIHTIFLGGQEYGKLSSFVNATKSSSIIAFFMRPPFHYGLLSELENLALCVGVMVLALFAAHRLWNRGLHFSSVMMILIAGAIGSPVAWDHYFIFAPLLIGVGLEAGWHSALGRTALVAAVLAIVPWFLFRTPVNNDWWASSYAFVARNALLLSSLAVVVAAVPGRRARHRAPRRASAHAATGPAAS